MRIVAVTKNNFSLYKKFRLRALQLEPLAYRHSQDDLIVNNQEYSKQRKTFLALHHKEVIGMMSVVFSNLEKTSHVGQIFEVYVKKEFRRLGVGKRLLEKLIHDTSETLSKLRLKVNTELYQSIEFYKKNGFSIVGTLRNEIKIGNNLYDEHVMEYYYN